MILCAIEKRRSLSCRLLTMALFILTFVSSFFASQVLAQSAPEPSPLVQVKAWVVEDSNTDAQPFAVTQQVVLTIEVSTSRWFLGATVIPHIDVPDLIAKQRNSLATNYSDRVDGQSWVHQRWEITLYPQSSGQYTLPALPISVTIAGQDGQKQAVMLHTKPLSFAAILPDARLTAASHWFAASQVNVNQTWEQSEGTLHVGDAVTRSINIEADNSLSILLPTLLNETPSRDYQAYAEPQVLNDQSTRGDYSSSRQEKVVYILQRGGEVIFPALTLTWWNTETQKVETIQLEGKTLHIHHTPASFMKEYWPWIAGMLIFLAILTGAFVGAKTYLRTHPMPLSVLFLQALRRRDYKTARLLIYVKLQRQKGRYAFQQTEDLQDIGVSLMASQNNRQLKSSWKRIQQNDKKKHEVLKPLQLAQEMQRISKD